MSQRDGFAGGFFAGAIVGSVVGGVFGGVLGALVVARRDEMPEEEIHQLAETREAKRKHATRRQQIQFSDTESMETARRSLEDKIAQLNATIDEVRQQLGTVNGASSLGETEERTG